MTIRQKLFLNAVLFMGCLFCGGATGYFFIDRVANVSQELFEQQALPVIKLNEIERASQTVFTQTLMHCSNADTNKFARIEALMKASNDEVARKVADVVLRSRGSSAALAASMEEFRGKWAAFNSIREEALALSRNFAKEDALLKVESEGKDAYDAADEVLRKLLIVYRHDMTVSRDNVIATRSRALLLIIVLVVAVVAGVAMITFSISRSILMPLNVATDMLKDIAQGAGDLTKRIRIERKDEIGRLAKYYNDSAGKINDTIVQVKDASGRISAGIGDMKASSQQIADGAQQQSASFEELTSSVQSNAENVRGANALAQEVSRKATDAGRAMHATISSMSGIEKGSKRMAEVVSLITDIAEQTNLLALNAAIEAARAGEYGKGFAVVADEVRQLAKRSAVSAKEIKELIKDNLKQVEDGVRISEEAGQMTRHITESIKKIADQLEHLTNSSQEQAAAMEENTSITEANASTSEKLAYAAKQMAGELENLKKTIGQFTTEAQSVAVMSDTPAAPVAPVALASPENEMPRPAAVTQERIMPRKKKAAGHMALPARPRKDRDSGEEPLRIG